MIRKQTQTFNDGIVKIYGTENAAEAGNMPVDGLTLKETLLYDERVVGFGRYYSAMQNNIKVDMVLRCQKRPGVATQDIAVPIDGEQYEIKQVQYPPDVEPPCMDITLEKVKVKHELT